RGRHAAHPDLPPTWPHRRPGAAASYAQTAAAVGRARRRSAGVTAVQPVGGPMRNRTALRCAAAASVLLLAGCSAASSGTQSASSGPAKPIIVGFATAQSGAFSSYDIPAVQGAKMEIAKINASGGLDGHKIET